VGAPAAVRLEGRGATVGDMIKKFDKKDEESGTGLAAAAAGREPRTGSGAGHGGKALRGAVVRRAVRAAACNGR